VGDPVAPRRVLVVARWYPSYDDPGRGSFVADQVRALTDAGIRVTVASFEPAMLRGEVGTRAETGALAARRWRDAVARPDAVNVPAASGATGVAGVPVARLPVVLEPGDRLVDVEVEAHADPLLAFGEALDAREGIDLIHAHTAVPDGLAAARLATALGVPLVVTEHASLVREQLADEATAAAVRTLVGPGRRLLAVSGHLARLMEERLDVPAGTVGVIPNVVPAALFPAATRRPGAGEHAGGATEAGDAAGAATEDATAHAPVELLWVGARKGSKGTDTLLRSFGLVRRERSDVALRLVGRAPTDEEEHRLRALAVDLGVEGTVSFDPPVPREGVAPAMRRATLFVHPSPFETFGTVAAEALLVGLPVAATPSGVEAIVGTDGACGEIAASAEPADLAAAVLRALDRIGGFDPAVMRDRVLGRCSPEAVLAATLDAYADAHADAAATMPVRAGGRPEAPVGGAKPSPTAAPIVVCLNRTVALRAIPRLPAAALEETVVVTGPPTRQAPDPAPAAGRWRELDPAGAYRDRMAELTTQAGTGMGGRLRALSSAGARHRERDAMAADKDGWIAAAGRRAMDAIRDEASGADGTPPQVIAVEAADVAVALPLLDAGAPLAPGGLRWLADRSEARRDA
jgi:glycosyltransferase involved in cell wall biosynthesis